MIGLYPTADIYLHVSHTKQWFHLVIRRPKYQTEASYVQKIGYAKNCAKPAEAYYGFNS